METTFFLLNHVFCKANADETIKGRVSYPLDEKGIQELEELITPLKSFSLDRILSSDLSPVLEMGERLSTSLHIPLLVDPEVRIRYSGMWAGKDVDFSRRVFAVAGEVPGREDPLLLTVRMVSAAKKIARQHTGEKILWIANSSSTEAVDSYFKYLDNDPALKKKEKTPPFSLIFSVTAPSSKGEGF